MSLWLFRVGFSHHLPSESQCFSPPSGGDWKLHLLNPAHLHPRGPCFIKKSTWSVLGYTSREWKFGHHLLCQTCLNFFVLKKIFGKILAPLGHHWLPVKNVLRSPALKIPHEMSKYPQHVCELARRQCARTAALSLHICSLCVRVLLLFYLGEWIVAHLFTHADKSQAAEAAVTQLYWHNTLAACLLSTYSHFG